MAEGKVYLVGGGPGAYQYLTLRAVELLERADAILYDRLIPAQALALARPEAELIYVGKDGLRGEVALPQREIEERMIALARSGKEVVRFKGGDPLVFGRGGEEAQRLAQAGIPFEIVPGVTAALAAAAEVAIPLTYRGLASGVALLTAHEDPEKEGQGLDFAALATFPGTLVLYMGVGRLGAVTAALIEAGRPPGEPAAVVERAGHPRVRVVRSTLAEVATAAQEVGIRPPALTVIGQVAGLELPAARRQDGPLSGVTVTVTRAQPQAGQLTERLQRLGAAVVEAPVIRIVPLPAQPLDPAPYALICLTSANGVAPFLERLLASGGDLRDLAGKVVAAIGPGTAAALESRGIKADLVPKRFVAEGLLEALDESGLAERLAGKRALVARAREARETLPAGLAARGLTVDVVPLYETLPQPLPPPLLEQALSADYITFTAASTVRSFLAALPDHGAGLREQTTAKLVSIGPQTSAELRRHGLEADLEASRHDLEGLLSALLSDRS